MARDYTKPEVLDIIEREAKERNIPRDDFMRFAYIETGGKFDEQASRGPKGAKGLFQFVPDTAAQYGIAGRELDAVANTDAAARLYLDNQRSLVRQHGKDDRPYLSGKPSPDGLDMYMAHQQGAGGYRSLQAAIATGSFSRADTRGNLLNNVSSRDIEAVAGVSMAEFRKMSDKDMAQTFVKYWDTKFDRVRIPEKGIEPVTDGTTRTTPRTPTETTPKPQPTPTDGDGIKLTAAYAMGVKYDNVGYKMGGKNVEQGVVDCSGWVVALQNKTMAEINQKAGREVFERSDLFSPGYDGSGTIVKKAAERSGVLLEGKQVNAASLKEGMVIGLDTGPAAHDKWKGIDHVAMVVRNPDTGALMVTESKGGKNDRGVRTIPVEDFLNQYRNAKLFAADPLVEARGLLQGKDQTQTQTQPKEQPAGQALADGKLSHGERGKDVEGLQKSLIALGIVDNAGKPLTGTGYYGDRTREVVTNFQKANGIEPTGIADKATLEAIGRKLPDGKVTVERAEITGVVPGQQPTKPTLVSDAAHPNHALFDAITKQLPAGTKPEVAANITLQAMENGITSADKLKAVTVQGGDAFVMGTTPGQRTKVDLAAPTPTLEAMSAHMAGQTPAPTQTTPQPRVAMQQ